MNQVIRSAILSGMANYLEDKDLLNLIHRNKLRWCSYLNEADTNQDAVVGRDEDLDAFIAEHGQPNMVIRHMTKEHIPKLDRQRRAVLDKDIPQLPFPPFKHYRLDQNLEPVEVLRSHWKGGIHDGEFSSSGGKLDERIGQVFFTLVEKIARKPNWSGYSYLEEMKGAAMVNLVHRGLMFDESKGGKPFAYWTTAVERSFLQFMNGEKKLHQFRDTIIEDAGLNSSRSHDHTLMTLGEIGFGKSEKVVVTRGRRGRPPTPVEPKTAKAITADYKNGMSITAIARTYQVPSTRVAKIVGHEPRRI